MSSSDAKLVAVLERIGQIETKRLEEIYIRHGVNPSEGINSLVAEIRRDGANTFVTWLGRWGEGVSYDEIVSDVAWAIGAVHGENASLDERESAIVKKVLAEMTPEERAAYGALRERIRQSAADRNAFRAALKAAATAGLYAARMKVVVFLIQQGMKKGAARAAGAWIPGVNVILGLLTANDVAGPAYRKTIPTVIDLAFFRWEAGEF